MNVTFVTCLFGFIQRAQILSTFTKDFYVILQHSVIWSHQIWRKYEETIFTLYKAFQHTIQLLGVYIIIDLLPTDIYTFNGKSYSGNEKWWTWNEIQFPYNLTSSLGFICLYFTNVIYLFYSPSLLFLFTLSPRRVTKVFI